MPNVNLTPKFVENAQAEPGSDRTLYWDDRTVGFALMVTAKGAKSYVLQYRAKGRSRRMRIGGVALPLMQARQEARARLGEVARGGDPLMAKRQAAGDAKGTLKSVAEQYLKRKVDREGQPLRSLRTRRNIFERLIYPKLGARPIGDIRRSEIHALLDRIEDRNGRPMARQTYVMISGLMRWHASRDDDFRSPITPGMRQRSEKSRERVLTPAELRAVWRAAEGITGPVGYWMRFLLLTATRLNEAARMSWSEVKGDDWTIPASRYKTKVPHLVPLSTVAKAILAEVPRLKGCDFVFTFSGERPMSGFDVFKKQLHKASGTSGWTFHDLRRTARTLMAEVGVPNDHAERVLGHAMTKIRGTYDIHAYRAEKLAALEALAKRVAEIVQ